MNAFNCFGILSVILSLGCTSKGSSEELEGIWVSPKGNINVIKKYEGNNPGYFITARKNNFIFVIIQNV